MGLNNKEFWSVVRTAEELSDSYLGTKCSTCFDIVEVNEKNIKLHLGPNGTIRPETGIKQVSLTAVIDRQSHEAISMTIDQACTVFAATKGT